MVTADLHYLSPAPESTDPLQCFPESSVSHQIIPESSAPSEELQGITTLLQTLLQALQDGTASPQDLQEISALLQVLQDSSAPPQGLQEILTLLQDLQESTAPPQDLQVSSFPLQGVQESPAPPLDLYESSVPRTAQEKSGRPERESRCKPVQIMNPHPFTVVITFPLDSSAKWSGCYRTVRCICVVWCIGRNLEYHITLEGWNSFLILSCLSVFTTHVDAHSEQSLQELQILLKNMTPLLEGCTKKLMLCYLLELNVILHEENGEEKHLSVIYDLIKHYNSANVIVFLNIALKAFAFSERPTWVYTIRPKKRRSADRVQKRSLKSTFVQVKFGC
ncbi:interleukin 15 [Silurus meridionalis]|nr:interleukin 15 [Silurus meridionalis]